MSRTCQPPPDAGQRESKAESCAPGEIDWKTRAAFQTQAF
jgi:hypothetical protein